MHSTPVAIIGGGPVGLMLALFLDHYGVRCTLFNTEPTTRWHPKGNGQNSRTMEHYRTVGIVDRIRALGIPPDHPFDHVVMSRLSRHEIFRFVRPTQNERLAIRRTTPVTDQYVEPMYHVNQMYVERAMLERARTRPNIDVRFGWKVHRFEQTAAGVSVVAAPSDGGAEVAWQAQYAVGCDGAQGFVRKALGIRYEGDVSRSDYFAGRLYSFHMRIPDLYPRFLGHRRAWMYWTYNPDSGGVIIALNGRDEFMMLAKPNREQGEVDSEEVVRWIKRAIGADIPVEILGYRPWNAGAALVAERYGSGRVLLCGDAVHLFTPTGGFGMSTGIDDTSNLAWKLAALVQGWGGPHLLASYESERKPIGYRNTGAARQIARAWGPPDAPPEIDEDSPRGEAARRAALNSSFIRNNHFFRDEEVDATGVQLGARYDGSPLIVPDGDPPAENFDEYVPSGVPGGRAPHLWLDARREIGSSLFDRLGRGFTLLRLRDVAADTRGLEQAAARRGVPFTVLDVTLPEGRELYARDFALIRPDQYICWRGDRLPDDPDALLAKVTGHVPVQPRRAERRSVWAEDVNVD